MIVINERYCKGCGICIHLCPKHILEVSKEVNSRGHHPPHVTDLSECGNCHQCELFCPDFAIFIAEKREDGNG